MKPEPLKGKRHIWCEQCKEHYAQEDVAAAVEWLKSELTDLYHSYGKPKVWALNNDELCDKLEEFVFSKIDAAFADVVEKKEEGK